MTHLDGVPSHYAALLETQAAALTGLSCVVMAGEVLPPELVRQHRRATPDDSVVVNEYGATEVAVWATGHVVRGDARLGPAIPVGSPIRNATVHVLDDELEPVAVGMPGEVYIGGAGVARGYCRAPGLTAERFVPDPFGPPGDRLYRVGDLARRLPSGELEFLGRVDDQVKIRGFRVEPGEIEAVLRRHAGVSMALVSATRDRGDVRLVANVVAAGEENGLVDELRRFVSEHLPSYLVPSEIVVVAELPKNRNGKLDRSTVRTAASAERSTSQPTTALEVGVAKIVCDVLGIDSVSLTDDFFGLGGSSLHLTCLGARLTAAYEIDVPMHLFFSVPTVAGISAVLELYRSEGRQGVVGSRSPEEVAAECVLDEAIDPTGLPLADIAEPKDVLLTGATGYLGIFVLDQFLRRTGARVHCLLRAGCGTRAWPGCGRRPKSSA